MQLEQVVFSVLLAVLAAAEHPNKWAIFFCVLAVGIGNALSGPAIGALLPTLVPREDLPGAVSLQSVQMNLSRVIGPAIGAPLYAVFGVATVFGLNALDVRVRDRQPARGQVPGAHHAGRRRRPASPRFLSGFKIAAADPLIRRMLVTMTLFSFFCLTFVGLMPEIAEANFHIGPKSIVYGFLYATFGLGAALGAVSVGTYLAHHSKAKIARRSLVAFAVLLTGFALVRGRRGRVPRRVHPRLRLLHDDHVAVDLAPVAPRRRDPRPDHGPLDHGVRRRGPARGARRRRARRIRQHHGGDADRRGRSRSASPGTATSRRSARPTRAGATRLRRRATWRARGAPDERGRDDADDRDRATDEVRRRERPGRLRSALDRRQHLDAGDRADHRDHLLGRVGDAEVLGAPPCSPRP